MCDCFYLHGPGEGGEASGSIEAIHCLLKRANAPSSQGNAEPSVGVTATERASHMLLRLGGLEKKNV